MHATEPACCFPRTLRAAADSHSLFRPDVCACSPSQICPEGTVTPSTVVIVTRAVTTIWPIVLSAIGSVVGILVGVFRVYPAIKARVDKLREAGIKPTLKRVVFLQKTLSKYRPLLEPSERNGSFQTVAQNVTPYPSKQSELSLPDRL